MTYPEWQESVRKAWDKTKAAEAEEHEKRAQKERAEEAAALKGFLDAAGIPGDPDSEVFEKDGYIFRYFRFGHFVRISHVDMNTDYMNSIYREPPEITFYSIEGRHILSLVGKALEEVDKYVAEGREWQSSLAKKSENQETREERIVRLLGELLSEMGVESDRYLGDYPYEY